MTTLQSLGHLDMPTMLEEDLMEVSIDTYPKLTTDEDIDIELDEVVSRQGQDELMEEDENNEEPEDGFGYGDLDARNDEEMVDDLDVQQPELSDTLPPDPAQIEEYGEDEILLGDEALDGLEDLNSNDTNTFIPLPVSGDNQSSESALQEDLFSDSHEAFHGDSTDREPPSKSESDGQLAESQSDANIDQIPAISIGYRVHHDQPEASNITTSEGYQYSEQQGHTGNLDEDYLERNETDFEIEENGHEYAQIDKNSDKHGSSLIQPDGPERHALPADIDSTEEYELQNQREVTATTPRIPDAEHEQVHRELQPKTDGTTPPSGSQIGEQRIDDGSALNTTVHQSTYLHPVIVVYQDSEMFLFPPPQDNEQSQTYFLQDEKLANESMSELLQECRNLLGGSISENDELEIEIPLLNLRLGETTGECPDTSLSQILDLYLQLHHNDGVESPLPLYMTLIARPTFSHRLEYLYTSVAEGRGISHVADHDEREDAQHSDGLGEVNDAGSVREVDPDDEYATKDQSEKSYEDQDASSDKEALHPSTDHLHGNETPHPFGVESQVANEDNTFRGQSRDRGIDAMTLEGLSSDTVSSIDESKIQSTNYTIDDTIEGENVTDAQKEEFVLDTQLETSKEFVYDPKEVANNDAMPYNFEDGDSYGSVDDDHVSVKRGGKSATSSKASSTIRGDESVAVSDRSQAGELPDVNRNIGATASDKPLQWEGVDNDGDHNDLGSDGDQLETLEFSEADALLEDLHKERKSSDHIRSEEPTPSSTGDLEPSDDDLHSNMERGPGDIDLLPEDLTAEDSSVPEDEATKEERVELEDDEINYAEDEDTIEDEIPQQGRNHDFGEDTSGPTGFAAESGSLKRTRATEEDDDVSVDVDETQAEVKRIRSG